MSNNYTVYYSKWGMAMNRRQDYSLNRFDQYSLNEKMIQKMMEELESA